MEIRGSSVAVHRARNDCVMERWSGDATKVPLFADLGVKPVSNDAARHGGRWEPDRMQQCMGKIKSMINRNDERRFRYIDINSSSFVNLNSMSQ